MSFKDTEEEREKANMSEGSSSSHPDQLKALQINNPQFRKQAKVNFHANCSVTIQECSESIQLCRTVKREEHAIPAQL